MASQESDIPNKIVKDNHNIFGPFIHKSLNQVIECSKFPKALKMANITAIFKKTERTDKTNYRPVRVFFQICPKFMSDVYMIKY